MIIKIEPIAKNEVHVAFDDGRDRVAKGAAKTAKEAAMWAFRMAIRRFELVEKLIVESNLMTQDEVDAVYEQYEREQLEKEKHREQG